MLKSLWVYLTRCDSIPFVQMISAEAPVLFAKAAQIFITELTLRAWIHTEDNKRRTLQVRRAVELCELIWLYSSLPSLQFILQQITHTFL